MTYDQQLTERRRDAMWRQVLNHKRERAERTRMDPTPTEDRPVVWFMIVALGLVALLVAGFLAGAGVAILTQ